MDSEEIQVAGSVRKLWKTEDGYEVVVDLSTDDGINIEIEIPTDTHDPSEAVRVARRYLHNLGAGITKAFDRDSALL